MRIGLALIALASAVLALGAASARAAGTPHLTVVQANVGNVNVPGCAEQVFKLCLRPVEERATAALAELSPHVIALQEILPPDLCDRAPAANPFNLCSQPLEPPSQVERLLGGRHEHACDERYSWDCLAVRRPGVRLVRASTRPVLQSCPDDGFTIVVATIRVRGWPVTATSAHPDSTRPACRADQIRDLVERAIPRRGPVLLLGDWNLDPYREHDESVEYWRSVVEQRFRPISGAQPTSVIGPSHLDPTGQATDGGVVLPVGPLAPRTIDHVLVRGANGACETARIDGGGGMDHRALVCRVRLGRHAAPRMRLAERGCLVGLRLRPVPSHLRGVRLRVGGRRVTLREAPFRMERRGAERRAGARIRARPLLVGGPGPRESARLPSCGGRESSS